MTSPICSNTQLPAQPPPQAPSKSPGTEQVRTYYHEIERMAGVLGASGRSEFDLQQLFTESYVGLLQSNVKAPGKLNKLENLLSNKLGWVRWAWQNEGVATASGAMRQALRERSGRAGDLIRTYAQFEALPIIRELQGKATELLEPLVGSKRAQELLYDHVLVGQLLNLRNVSDSEVVANVVYQRYLKHYNTLAEIDPSLNVTDALDEISSRLIKTTDDLAQLARNSGVKIETQANAGYFPVRFTPEFDNYLRKTKNNWLGGYQSIKEKFQKVRTSNLPIVADLDQVTMLLQKQLLKREFPEGSLAELSAKELKVLEEQAEAAREAAEAVRLKASVESVEEAAALQAKHAVESKQTLASYKKELVTEDRGTLATLKQKLKLEQYTGAERAAIVKAERERLTKETTKKLLAREAELEESFNKTLDRHYQISARTTEEKVEQVFKQQEAKVQALLDFEKAKLTLADIATNPGGMSKFLHENFSPDKLQRLFDSGIIDSLPATSDELLEFMRTVDTGVRGLSDAILLNPVEAIKSYADDLAKAAQEHALFRTAFDEGSLAGWVVDEVPQGAVANYIRVGDSQLLQKHFQQSGLTAVASDLYIHKQAAEALNSLLEINTSPANISSVSSAFQAFLRPFRRMAILSGGVGYISRVFTQNVIANYSATGSVAQLPFAVVDTMRLLSGGFAALPNTKQVFKVGGKSYSAKELFIAMLGARGGHALASMQEPAELMEGTLKLFSKESRERAQHFNQLYTQKFGEPLTGKLQSAKEGAGDLFNVSYRALAFTNQFLDLTFRWSVVRELASTREWQGKSFEELMRRTDEYFSINADAGSFGSFAGNFLSPFAQFAINAPGSAIRHALRHPWRAGNIMTMYASAQASSGLSESELPAWMKENESYFFTMAKDHEGKHFVVLPGSVDYLLDSYNWFGVLARDLAGVNSSVGEAVESADNPYYRLQKHVADIAKKSYWWDVATGIMNVDSNTLKPYDLGANADTVLGVSLPRGIRSLITNMVPLLRPLEQALPAEVVGRAPTTKIVGGGLRVIDDPGVPSWTGAMPLQGGARKAGEVPPQVSAFRALTGIGVQEIDPQKNIIGSYKDLDSRMREIRTNRLAIYRRLVQSGSSATDYDRKKYQQLKDLEFILLSNKTAIDAHAAATGEVPPLVFERFQGRFDRLLTEPLKNDVMNQMFQEYQQP